MQRCDLRRAAKPAPAYVNTGRGAAAPRERVITDPAHLDQRMPPARTGPRKSMCPAQPPAKDDELVYDSKRMLGATFEELSAPRDGSAVSDLERWTFKVERGGANSSQPVITGACCYDAPLGLTEGRSMHVLRTEFMQHNPARRPRTRRANSAAAQCHLPLPTPQDGTQLLPSSPAQLALPHADLFVRTAVKEKGVVKRYPAEEISAMVLGRLKAAAELHFNAEVRNVVITVPAYFTDAQRQVRPTHSLGTGSCTHWHEPLIQRREHLHAMLSNPQCPDRVLVSPPRRRTLSTWSHSWMSLST